MICSQLKVQVQWSMTVSFGDQSAKAEKSWHYVSPLWTKTGVLQKLPANGLHIRPVTHTSWKLIKLVRSLSDWIHI